MSASTANNSVSTTFVCVIGNENVSEVLLKSNVNLLFFGNQETCTNVWKERRKFNLLDKTFCVRLEYADLPDSKNENLRTVLLEEGLYGEKSTDPENTYRKVLENWSQFFYLKRATELNPFETTHFCWLNQNISELSEENLQRVNESWNQENILIKGFRIIQTGVVEEDIFLDARNFYNRNWVIVNDSLMGGTTDEICSIFEKVERQKNYILKIKKVVLLYDILARISYFFNESFNVINTVNIIKDNKKNNYFEYFCDIQIDVSKIIESGRNLRCQEKLHDATEVLGKLADLLIQGNIKLTKDQIFSIFYDLTISTYYVNYNKYKVYTEWFKNYIKEKDYTIDDNFSMNLSF